MKVYALFHYDKYEGDTLMKLYLKFPTFRDLHSFRNIHSGDGLCRDEIYNLLEYRTTGYPTEGYELKEIEVEEN